MVDGCFKPLANRFYETAFSQLYAARCRAPQTWFLRIKILAKRSRCWLSISNRIERFEVEGVASGSRDFVGGLDSMALIVTLFDSSIAVRDLVHPSQLNDLLAWDV